MKNPVEKYISFLEFPNVGKKTRLWGVYSQRNLRDGVGTIKWHGAWRKYCYFPLKDTLYDYHCMRLIADYCEEKTKEHYAKKRAPKLHTEAKKDKLTRKERGFAADVAAGMSGTKAARKNYNAKNDNVAAVIASENLRKPKIIKVLADAFPDPLLQQKHLELLNSSHLDNMNFPLGPKNKKEWLEDKKQAERILAEQDEIEDEEGEESEGVRRLTYTELERYRKLVAETECLTDDDIVEMLESSNCRVKKIVRIYGQRQVYFWSPDNLARDKALDKAYKIKGSYAAEKRELTGSNGEPLFNDDHRKKSDKALEDLLG